MVAAEEKRKSPRLGVSLPARLLCFAKGEQSSFSGLVLDAGPGGLKLRLIGAAGLRLGDEVTILINEAEPGETLRLSGEIIWLGGEAEPLGSLEAGVRFIGLEQGLMEQWAKIVTRT